MQFSITYNLFLQYLPSGLFFWSGNGVLNINFNLSPLPVMNCECSNGGGAPVVAILAVCACRSFVLWEVYTKSKQISNTKCTVFKIEKFCDKWVLRRIFSWNSYQAASVHQNYVDLTARLLQLVDWIESKCI